LSVGWVLGGWLLVGGCCCSDGVLVSGKTIIGLLGAATGHFDTQQPATGPAGV